VHRLITVTSRFDACDWGVMAEDRIPDVIRFGYDDYKNDANKKNVIAKCRTCRATVSEKTGTTSGFVRHLSTSAHPTLRKQLVNLLNTNGYILKMKSLT